jgi:hypothetical protein
MVVVVGLHLCCILVEQCSVIRFLWSQGVELSQECYHHYGENCCAKEHLAIGEECQ